MNNFDLEIFKQVLNHIQFLDNNSNTEGLGYTKNQTKILILYFEFQTIKIPFIIDKSEINNFNPIFDFQFSEKIQSLINKIFLKNNSSTNLYQNYLKLIQK